MNYASNVGPAWPDGAPQKDEWVTATSTRMPSGHSRNSGIAHGVVERAWLNPDDGVTWIQWRQLEPPAHKLRTMRLEDEGVVWIRGKHEPGSEAIGALLTARALSTHEDEKKRRLFSAYGGLP